MNNQPEWPHFSTTYVFQDRITIRNHKKPQNKTKNKQEKTPQKKQKEKPQRPCEFRFPTFVFKYGRYFCLQKSETCYMKIKTVTIYLCVYVLVLKYFWLLYNRQKNYS